MDDFRIGSVPASDPLDSRRTSDVLQRKRQRHRDEEEGQDPDTITDIFEARPDAEDAPEQKDDESIEDYYLPADPGEAE